MRVINVRESNMWKTGVPACYGKQASRLLLQLRQAGKPACHDSRDGLYPVLQFTMVNAPSYWILDDINVAAVPEPGTLGLIALGALGFARGVP